MPLKGPLWLMGKCLEEERRRGKLTDLAAKALDLGVRRTESTRGHVFQACGAVQQFLREHPRHRAAIKVASPTEPFKPSGQLLRDWKSFIKSRSGSYERESFSYDYDTLKGYLTPKYGGKRRGGGGGDNEFEIVMRLLADFLQ
jgi:hypothetical protein